MCHVRMHTIEWNTLTSERSHKISSIPAVARDIDLFLATFYLLIKAN